MASVLFEQVTAILLVTPLQPLLFNIRVSYTDAEPQNIQCYIRLQKVHNCVLCVASYEHNASYIEERQSLYDWGSLAVYTVPLL